MQPEIVPVRAWAEFDDVAIFVNKEMVPGGFAFYRIPKTGEHEPLCGAITSGVERVIRNAYMYGPLRELRVLLSDGHEVTLDVAEALVVDDLPELGYDAEWQLTTPDEHRPWMTQIASWEWTEGADAEAVERALTEAIAWFAGQEGDG